MKHNIQDRQSYWKYLAGFFIILVLPILTIPPWFFPADWGKTIVLRTILSVIIFCLAFEVVFKGRIATQETATKKNIILWALGFLGAVFFLATLFSVDIHFSLWGSPGRSGGFVNFFAYLVLAALMYLVIKKEDWQKVWNISIATGLLVCAVAVIQFYGLFSDTFIPVRNRPPSTLGNPDFLAMYLMLLLFPAVLLLIQSWQRQQKNITQILYYIFSIAAFIYVILIAGSRSVYLGILVGILYAIIAYPKKLLWLKTTFVILLMAVMGVMLYANAHIQPPEALAHNKIFNAVYSRLSVEKFLDDARFYEWKIAIKAFADKPIIGWGPENFSVGFDKHYDPSLPYIGDAASDWWDRAHNIFFDIGVQAGALGILAYFGLFAIVFWQLRRVKKHSPLESSKISAHLMQTGLVAYLAANVFSFDSFATYLIFFVVISYSMMLCSSESNVHGTVGKVTGMVVKNLQGVYEFIKRHKTISIGVLFLMLCFFIWQYNIVPLWINKNINVAENLARSQRCDQSMEIMENVMTQHSILDARARMKYVELMKICANTYPEKNLTYAKRGVQVMKEALAIQPLFSRLWIFLGGFTTVEASAEKDPAVKEKLLKEANQYLAQAAVLAPDHQELILEQAKTLMVSQDYKGMFAEAQRCVDLYPGVGDCYFLRAVADIYLKHFDQVDQDLEIAKSNAFDTGALVSLNQLVNAYATTENYELLAKEYLALIELRPDVAQYHSSLAFTYSKMGAFTKARQEAQIFLKLMPDQAEEVNAFLQTLGH